MYIASDNKLNKVKKKKCLNFSIFFFVQCDLEYCVEQMVSESKFGDCPKYPNNTDARVSCFDDCDGQDYR